MNTDRPFLLQSHRYMRKGEEILEGCKNYSYTLKRWEPVPVNWYGRFVSEEEAAMCVYSCRVSPKLTRTQYRHLAKQRNAELDRKRKGVRGGVMQRSGNVSKRSKT